MEWVDHCAAFADYVVGKPSKGKGHRIPTVKSGAHERYYPDEWPISKCNDVLSDPKNKERLREVYGEICSNFSPVYRYFFVETFGHSAELWFQAKMRYTRSVATSSIVGHILGIGEYR
jgi:serine-protein kinase ATM